MDDYAKLICVSDDDKIYVVAFETKWRGSPAVPLSSSTTLTLSNNLEAPDPGENTGASFVLYPEMMAIPYWRQCRRRIID
jgi:hypothetical protein